MASSMTVAKRDPKFEGLVDFLDGLNGPGTVTYFLILEGIVPGFKVTFGKVADPHAPRDGEYPAPFAFFQYKGVTWRAPLYPKMAPQRLVQGTSWDMSKCKVVMIT